METKGEIRKQYKKPQVSQVKLEIEEAVLANCKGAGQSGKNATGCQQGVSSNCKTTFGS
jgi:hypothetical protein